MFSAIKFAIMLTKEELENYLAELKRYAESGDPECAHGGADGVLCEIVSKLGYQEIVDAWEEVPKYYI
jgi:hypothetical protein